jgi:hypothetical protein
MKKISLVVLAAVCLGACSTGQDINYHPAPQILPVRIKKIAVKLVANKTQQFGLEDKLTLSIRDEFLRDGTYPIVPESEADGFVLTAVTRYILTPIQYDARLVPTVYKLVIIINLQFVDRPTNQALWEEPNIEGVQVFSASTLPGGMTEEQARELIYAQLSQDVVKRVVHGFGSITGKSQRIISPTAPSTEPLSQPEQPLAPVNSNPY